MIKCTIFLLSLLRRAKLPEGAYQKTMLPRKNIGEDENIRQ